jgi:hypothetical protein
MDKTGQATVELLSHFQHYCISPLKVVVKVMNEMSLVGMRADVATV